MRLILLFFGLLLIPFLFAQNDPLPVTNFSNTSLSLIEREDAFINFLISKEGPKYFLQKPESVKAILAQIADPNEYRPSEEPRRKKLINILMASAHNSALSNKAANKLLAIEIFSLDFIDGSQSGDFIGLDRLKMLQNDPVPQIREAANNAIHKLIAESFARTPSYIREVTLERALYTLYKQSKDNAMSSHQWNLLVHDIYKSLTEPIDARNGEAVNKRNNILELFKKFHISDVIAESLQPSERGHLYSLLRGNYASATGTQCKAMLRALESYPSN